MSLQDETKVVQKPKAEDLVHTDRADDLQPNHVEPETNPYEHMRLTELEHAHFYLTSLLATTRERQTPLDNLIGEVRVREKLARKIIAESVKASERREAESKLTALVGEREQAERKKKNLESIIADCERKLKMIPTDRIEDERRRQADRVRLSSPRLPSDMSRLM